MYLIFILPISILIAALCLFLGRTVAAKIAILNDPVFVPSADDKLKTMLALPTISQKSKIIDLGSGDGKVLIALVQKFKLPVVGVELNPILVHQSRQKIAEARYAKIISVQNKSFWKVNLRPYDVVFLYGTDYIMKRLEQKVKTEMKPGSQFVSNHFQFSTLKPIKTQTAVYLVRL